ncbi:GTP-binding protein [Bengtsoniella intestinalis]|uniref:CobW family GTP-binding protein n=1 Tax=Bengtsoniella intestinalis TaxID=3073143 RepID=UPI00391FC7FF
MGNYMELYLITGFLGAGKTTFLKQFIRLFQGKRIHLVINEFGKEGVDGDLVREIGAVLSEINNGSIFCACKIDKFEEELQSIVTQTPDVILVEASGLADPTNIRKVLDTPAFSAIDYRGSVCLVDSVRFSKVVTTARVVAKQVKVSTLALVNKTDLATAQQLAQVEEELRGINPLIHLQQTTFGVMEPAWLDLLSPDIAVSEEAIHQDITLQKASITLAESVDLPTLKGILTILGEGTYRVKGFVRLGGQLHLVNAVGSYIRMEPYAGAHGQVNTLVALAGAGMSLRKTAKEAKSMYPEAITVISHGG